MQLWRCGRPSAPISSSSRMAVTASCTTASARSPIDRVLASERLFIHLRLARTPGAGAAVEPGGAGIFAIVGWSRAAVPSCWRRSGEREEVAAMHLVAGLRAKAGGAHAAALRFLLTAGRALLPPYDAFQAPCAIEAGLRPPDSTSPNAPS